MAHGGGGAGRGKSNQERQLMAEIKHKIGLSERPLPPPPEDAPQLHRRRPPPPPKRHPHQLHNGGHSPGDEVTALRQQLKLSKQELKKSNKMNIKLLRDLEKEKEKQQAMMKLQKLNADRQLAELGDDGVTSGLVDYTQSDDGTDQQYSNTERSHVTQLKTVRRHLSHRFDAQSMAASMFQRGSLTLRELQAIQKNNNQPIRAAERLIDVVIGQPYEVYESFMEAVKQNNRTDILDMIANSAFQVHASMTGHMLEIRQHYIYLLDTLDTKYSGLLDELYSAKVLSPREKSDIQHETSSYRQNEVFLSVLCYKSEDDYHKFLEALDKTDQGHVRNAVTGRTEQEQEQAARAYDDDDDYGDDNSTLEAKDSAEVVQLRLQLQELTSDLSEMRDAKSSLEQKLRRMTHNYQNCELISEDRGRRVGPMNPKFVVKLEVEDMVIGVAELDGIIYTVCHDTESIRSHSCDDSMTLRRHRDIVVRGLRDACDLVACITTRRLYVADQHGFWLVCPSSQAKVPKHINTSPIRPHSLSVRDGHVLVTSQHNKQLVQYSDHGREVGRVSLPGNLTLHHAAMTSRGTFVVCCNTTRRSASSSTSASAEVHQVMEVAVDGEMLQSFGIARDDDQLRWPWYVVVDQDSDTDAFLVADRNNYRVLHLSCDLRPTGVVIDDQGPTRLSPSRLSLVGDRLLIGHSSCVDVFTLR